MKVPYKIRKLPLVGPWASRIGRVVDIWGMPCNPDPEIWVTAAVRTSLNMAFALIKPSPTEYALTRFGVKHHSRPKFRYSAVALLEGQGVPVEGAFSTWLFRGAKLGAAVLNWVQIIDVTTQGTLQWGSLTYQWAGCQVPGLGGGNGTINPGQVVLGSTSGSALAAAMTVTFQHRCIGAACTWACAASQQWSCSWTVAWQEIPGFEDPQPTFYLSDGATTFGEVAFENAKGAPGENITGGYYRFLPPDASPKTFTLYFKAQKSFLLTGGHMSVSGGPNQDFFKPDP